MSEMGSVQKIKVIPRKPQPRRQNQADLAIEAQKIGAAVDAFEQSVTEEAPQPKSNGELSVGPVHEDPMPIFPDSPQPIPAPLRAVPVQTKVFEDAGKPHDKQWKLFGIGFVLGSLLIGGLISFILTSSYGTTVSNLKTENTQLQSQVDSLQKIETQQRATLKSDSILFNINQTP